MKYAAVTVLFAFGIFGSGLASAQSGGAQDATLSRVEQIIERFENANQWRNHVMVVAHRGSWWKDGEIVLAENSVAAINRAVALDVEMVELDVQQTSDGEYILLHDETLDRTTTCQGEVVEMPFEEVRQCNLIVEGTGEETEEVVPTLREAYEAIDGRVMMNVDIKLGVEKLAEVMQIAREMGVDDQIVIKNRTGNPEEVEAAGATLDAIGFDVKFMPILDDAEISGMAPIETTYEQFAPQAIEFINRFEVGDTLTEYGGLMFNTDSDALAIANDAHMWINVLFQGSPATLSGGRGDLMATLGGLPHEAWGFWAENGATIFQTDEPEALLAYLEENGYRIPYQE